MRRQLALLGSLLATLLLASACSRPCRLSTDCETGEHCDFVRGACITGCVSNDDCAPTSRCNTSLGNCVPTIIFTPAPDATTSTTSLDAGTSTSADGG